MKRYNFKTKKIYESVAAFKISLDEFDANGKLVDSKDFEDTYSTLDDAIEDTYEIMTNVAASDGINEDDVAYEQDGNTVVFTVEGIGKWVFTVESSQVESEKESYSNKEDLNEDMNYGRDLDPEVRNSKGWKITSIVRTNQNGKLLEEIPVEERMYVTYDDAVEDAFAKAQAMCQEMGFDFDNDVDRFEGGQRVIVILPDGTSLEFTLDKAQIRSYESKNESVAERFAKLRKMFESEDDADDNSDDNNDEGSEDDPGAKEAGEKEDNSDEKSDDEKSDDEKSDDEEEEDMKAVIITVKKGDEDKCKDELIDAGIAEDDIEILDADDDAENIDIRIDVNSVMELKDYLDKKGIDLEKEIGGEIVSDDEDSDSDDSDENKEDDDENKEGGDEEEFDFDNLGDIFGAEDAEE